MNSLKILPFGKAAAVLIIGSEIISKDYYNKNLQHPIVPGLESGITFAIGYDAGYNSAAQIIQDWRGHIADDELSKLALVAGLKGDKADAALHLVKEVSISFETASEVFTLDVLPRYCRAALQAYPGLELLAPDAIGAIVSLVYNRGTDLTSDPKDKNQRRREMANIKPLIAAKDYNGIADQIISMKRLWDGVANYTGAKEQRANGLLIRRDKEAALVRNAVHSYATTEIIQIPLN